MFDKRNSLLNNIRELGGLLAMFSVTAVSVLLLSETWVNF